MISRRELLSRGVLWSSAGLAVATIAACGGASDQRSAMPVGSTAAPAAAAAAAPPPTNEDGLLAGVRFEVRRDPG